jgi:hypothetical protein
MSEYPKQKTETYEMTGGVNTKASPYLNAPNEFRAIVNMNFFTPGALSKRPGQTAYAGVSGFVGATTTSQILGGDQFNSISNNYYSILFSDQNKLYVKDSTFANASLFPSGISNVIASGLSTPTDSVFSFMSFADRIFYANGNAFRRNLGIGAGATPLVIGVSTGAFDGGQTLTASFGDYKNTLPQVVTNGSETFIVGFTMIGGFTITLYRSQTFLASIASVALDYIPISQNPPTFIEGGRASLLPNMSGIYSWSFGFEDDRGFMGPESAAFGGSVLLNGITFNAVQINLDIFSLNTYAEAAAGGAKFLNIYRSLPDGGVRFLTKRFPLYLVPGATKLAIFANDPYNGFPVGGGNDYALTLGVPANSNLNLQNIQPRYLESYNNQLFVAGVRGSITTYADKLNQKGQYEPPVTETADQSTIYWSDIGEPEAFFPENFIEVRTNDGDRITGLKSYSGSLVITKQRSFHRLVGTDPTNFLLQEVSDQYGCISNQAMVVYEQKLWFLDQKGICEYNGANVKIVSNKVQPYFDAMNLSAASEFATAIHYKQQNEVWFAIPTNGSTRNNTIIVFDYLSDGWTVYEGINASYLFNADGTLPYRRPLVGGYSGTIRYMDPSNYSDAGAAMTCLIDTRFLADSGHSQERQYRRLFLDVDPVIGVTQPININLRTNFGTTILINRTMYQNPFQSRIDFGLSAKSIQAEIGHYSASLPFKVNGYTIESRYQRNV